MRLNEPIDVAHMDAATRRMLETLQGNILQSHGRTHAIHLFLSLGSAISETSRTRKWIRQVAIDRITNAWDEYQEAPPRKSPFFSLLLTSKGYDALNEPKPDNAAFQAGMAARREILNDPSRADWELIYKRDDIDALLILADNDAARLARDAVAIRADALDAGVRIIGEEPAHQLRRLNVPIEHFGYADGISQPKFFVDRTVPDERWDDSSPLNLILVEEQTGSQHYGSYLVFRKLEQNVAMWNSNISRLANALNVDSELAGALMIGRFKDGTPVVNYSVSQALKDPSNSFTFDQDPEGQRCPLQAHIRKTNPRTSDQTDDARGHRIARRGVSYGTRPDLHPAGGQLPAPDRGVGLLFMCYQANIEDQFEYIQKQWANDANYPRKGVGIDTMIGQLSPTNVTCPYKWLSPHSESHSLTSPLASTIRLVGGEYCFTASIAFLTSL